ncbi:CHAP domain-containing protein [Paenibacillus albus]|uniref:CHAP domain-containing protein n=2 Tax=Paenibacillus albus TaxID=2495582 RepID=A0A3S9ADA5_9BACL|nr:CHAP domain-containing protein [Paenibacillus albus]
MANNRFESIRVLVDEMLLSIENAIVRREASVYLFGVSTFASMLAMMRGENKELAAIAGLLHDYYGCKTSILQFPGPNSAEAARVLTRDIGLFTDEEQMTILRAIFYQNDLSRSHGPIAEIVKDAILLQVYFSSRGRRLSRMRANRLKIVLEELHITGECSEEFVHDGDGQEVIAAPLVNKRLKLADIAETLSRQEIIGVPGDERYREICRYWPDANIHKVLKNSWCAAFVYHCCREAGFLLPIRYPNASHRLAGVGAWLKWAKLEETGFFHSDNQNGFTPERGDIVIYEKLLSDHSHDHIGVVLDVKDNEILVAEGNRDNENYSNVLYRDRNRCILGYIRIQNDYKYEFLGEYLPEIQ